MGNLNETQRQLSYCGIYCGDCPMYTREISRTSEKLENLTAQAGFNQMAEYLPDMAWYTEFKEKLAWFRENVVCDGCRSDGRQYHEGCTLRDCCSARGIDFCPNCDNYPCNTVEEFKAQSPYFADNMKRIREVGVDAYIEEQKKAGLPEC